jgi:hypothetical protein
MGNFGALERWWGNLAEPDEIPLAQREDENLLWVRWQLAQGQAEDSLKPVFMSAPRFATGNCTSVTYWVGSRCSPCRR